MTGRPGQDMFGPMSGKLLECVPNFSEGRDRSIVDSIVASMTAVEGARCLASEMDHSHHRSVVTLAGPAQALVEAAVRGARRAIERIDLRRHRGEHKRMGAIDVCPFVPLGDSSMEDAVRAARETGQRIGEELELPVFLYGEACARPERRVLGSFRNKEFEGLLELVGKDPLYEPDFGPPRLHASAGAVAVGARNFLIAYNINLATGDVGIAKAIAKAVRERDGGLPRVQAMGFFLDDLRVAQVSMNLLDFRVTSIRRIFDEVSARAEAAGVSVAESELVGLAPSAALDEQTARHVKLRGFDPDRQIVERRLALASEGR
ncbi:MAG: glutamate formimidoyltransferase [Planctomycetota bacterium]